MNQHKFWGFLSHTSIIVGMMFVILFVIDRFNPAMDFLGSSLSKWLILVLAVSAFPNGLPSAVYMFQKRQKSFDRQAARADAARNQSRLPPAGHSGGAPRRPQTGAPAYDRRDSYR